MKKILLSIGLVLSSAIAAMAQAPQMLNYQGIARSTSGAPLTSASIGLQITIHDATPAGAVVYQETHTTTTNAFGLYSAAVGGGTVVTGTFAGINWASGPKYMEVGIDPAGGSSYTSAGTAQLLSAPYALYSNTTGSVSGTTNYVSKFTSATAIGNSHIIDNGTTVGIDTSTPTAMCRLQVSGVGTFGALPYYQAGIVADGAPTAVSGTGVYGECGWRGVYGRNPGTAIGTEAVGVYGKCEGGSYTSYGFGTKGEVTGTGPTNYGAYGSATGGTTHNYGIYGTASGTGAYAGYFSGNVNITGSIAKGSGTFKIDHPLDPENKYLYHSFVESPDMMNIYNGNVVTNAAGEAIVRLPDYFDALNKDFRYQLTTIGQPAQAYILNEISGNTFVIKTDKPGVKVSWQVTGVRQDKYANAHRVVPEVEKEQEFKGHYLHAEEWGQPYSKSFDAVTTPAPAKDNQPVGAK